MKALRQKEWRLSMTPVPFFFLALSALLLIPSYPYYVTFFYTSLGVFLFFQASRENRDVYYMKKSSFFKNYWFIICMLVGIAAGCVVGAVWPGATALEPIGTVFINAMFCVVVPMVFVSISAAIANMKTPKRAGKVMGVTIVTFLCTAAIAAVLMYIVVSIINIVPDNFSVTEMVTKTEDVTDVTAGDLVVNFFTKPDFADLLSRKAMAPTAMSPP